MPKGKNKETIINLKERFVDGEKLTVDEIIKDYFTPNSPYSYLVAAKTVRSILHSIKRWFRKDNGLWFGNITDEGHYGLFTTEEEVRYAMIRYYRFVKGVVYNANILAANARQSGLLPDNITRERMLVATIKEEEKHERE